MRLLEDVQSFNLMCYIYQFLERHRIKVHLGLMKRIDYFISLIRIPKNFFFLTTAQLQGAPK